MILNTDDGMALMNSREGKMKGRKEEEVKERSIKLHSPKEH
jgi:hypothetical protein